MSRQVTIDLPDEVYRRAENLARLTSRDGAEVLAHAISISLPPLEDQNARQIRIEDRTDDEVLALTQLQLPPEQNERLSVLLDRQQAGRLAVVERGELQIHMQLYQQGLLLKSEALREAAQRGLRGPLM